MPHYNDEFWAWIFFGGIMLACAFLIIKEDISRLREKRADNKILETVEEFHNEVR